MKNLILIILIALSATTFAQTGIGTTTPNASAQLDVTSTTKGFLPPRMTEAQRDGISNPATGLIIYQTDGTAGLYQYNGTAWAAIGGSSSTTYSVGDLAQGGIVFWVDETGQHGLVAATADQSAGLKWYNGSFTITNAVRDGIGAGMYNTERIIANQGVGSYAAQLCANYKGGDYGDWYLPSKYEISLLYLQKTAVGGFTSVAYWSSSEISNANAWLQPSNTGTQSASSKHWGYGVRAIRAF